MCVKRPTRRLVILAISSFELNFKPAAVVKRGRKIIMLCSISVTESAGNMLPLALFHVL